MYAEHCDDELRISYRRNCGLLYPETIKKVLNLNRHDDLKVYLEGISKSAEWKALYNMYQNIIHLYEQQLMYLNCTKLLLANAFANNNIVVSRQYFVHCFEM